MSFDPFQNDPHGSATHQDQLIRAFRKLRNVRIKGVRERLQRSGWVIKPSYAGATLYTDVVWEDPLVTQHNASLSDSQVLSSHFCTVYSLVDDMQAGQELGDYLYLVGRIGNTTSLMIWKGEEYQEEREDVLSQLHLF